MTSLPPVTKCALLDQDVARHHRVTTLTAKEHCLLLRQHFTYTNICKQWLLFEVMVLYHLARQGAAYTDLLQQYFCVTGILSYFNTLPTNYVI